MGGDKNKTDGTAHLRVLWKRDRAIGVRSPRAQWYRAKGEVGLERTSVRSCSKSRGSVKERSL